MDDYFKRFRRPAHHSHHGGGYGHTIRKFKKIFFIVATLIVLAVVSLVILAIVGIVWLFNRGDNVQQVAQDATSQVQSLTTPLNLESYITNGQVNTDRLQQVYESLPSQLQDDWLRQLNTQIEQLKSQASVPSETIKTLTDFYNRLAPN